MLRPVLKSSAKASNLKPKPQTPKTPKTQTPKSKMSKGGTLAKPKPAAPKGTVPTKTPLATTAATLSKTTISSSVNEALTARLTAMYGVGPQLAALLIQHLHAYKLAPRTSEGLASYSDAKLRAALKDHRIYMNLPAATKMDLDEHPLNRIPRELIDLLDKELDKYASQIGAKYTVAGSYLRGAATSGDIDIVLEASSKPKRTPLATWEALRKKINESSNILTIREPFGQGTDKVGSAFEIKVPSKLRSNEHFKGYIDSSFKVRFKTDVFLTTKNEYEIALLYATGSGMFNIRMRALAKKKGYMLNQHALYKVENGKHVDTGAKTQQDVFKILGIRWREPAQRNY